MKVIGITGYKRSGKDTAAAYYKDVHGYIQLSFAAKLKDVVNKYVGCVSENEGDREDIQTFTTPYRNLIKMAQELNIPHERWYEYQERFIEVFEPYFTGETDFGLTYTTSYRAVLQLVGSEVCRHFQNDIWVDQIRNVLENPENKDSNFVISDVRFDNEARMLRDAGGVILRIHREGAVSDGHISEVGVSDKLIDYEIHNTTLEDLYTQLSKLV